MTSRPLSDKQPACTAKILLTRPQGSNERLAAALQLQGHDVRVLPLLAIQPCPETAQLKQTVMNIDHYQHVICCSKHAAGGLADYLDQYWPQMPTAIHWYALGSSSASPLEKIALKVNCPGTGTTSEDVLAMAALQQVTGQKILLVKGQGGRPELQQVLTQRGAVVNTLELYQRNPLSYPDDLAEELLLVWRPDLVVLLSGAALEQFHTLNQQLPPQTSVDTSYASRTGSYLQVIVPGKRLAQLAASLGFQPVSAASAEHADILRAINAAAGPGSADTAAVMLPQC